MQPISRRSALFGGASLVLSTPAFAQDRFANAAVRRLTDTQWRARLQPAAYSVLRHAATERAGTSRLNDEHRRGTFSCAGCGLALFQSQWKFDSGTGWPSFNEPIPGAIESTVDKGSTFRVIFPLPNPK